MYGPGCQTFLLTAEMTVKIIPWRAILHKLIVSYLGKKFPDFRGTRNRCPILRIEITTFYIISLRPILILSSNIFLDPYFRLSWICSYCYCEWNFHFTIVPRYCKWPLSYFRRMPPVYYGFVLYSGESYEYRPIIPIILSRLLGSQGDEYKDGYILDCNAV